MDMNKSFPRPFNLHGNHDNIDGGGPKANPDLPSNSRVDNAHGISYKALCNLLTHAGILSMKKERSNELEALITQPELYQSRPQPFDQPHSAIVKSSSGVRSVPLQYAGRSL